MGDDTVQAQPLAPTSFDLSDMSSLATGRLSDEGRPMPLLHPVSGLPLTINGQPVSLLVAGTDSAAMRKGIQKAAAGQLEAYENAMAKHRRIVGAEEAWRKAAPDDKEAEIRRRANADLGILNAPGGGMTTEFAFAQRVLLASHAVVGWSGLVYEGSMEFSPERAAAFLRDCPWAMDQLENFNVSRSAFLNG